MIVSVTEAIIGEVVIPAKDLDSNVRGLEVVAHKCVHCANKAALVVNDVYVFSYEEVFQILEGKKEVSQ